MRLKITNSKSKKHYSIIEDYTNLQGKRTTRVVENLGNDDKLKEKIW